MSTIRKVIGVTIVDVALRTTAERLQYGGYCRRREAADAIRELARAGTSIEEIAQRTDRSATMTAEATFSNTSYISFTKCVASFDSSRRPTR